MLNTKTPKTVQKFMVDSLNKIKAYQERKHELFILGIDISELQPQIIDNLEESLAWLVTNKPLEVGLVLDDIQWWLYEKVNKIITVKEKKWDVNKVEDFVKWLFKFYNK